MELIRNRVGVGDLSRSLEVARPTHAGLVDRVKTRLVSEVTRGGGKAEADGGIRAIVDALEGEVEDLKRRLGDEAGKRTDAEGR